MGRPLYKPASSLKPDPNSMDGAGSRTQTCLSIFSLATAESMEISGQGQFCHNP